jgi:uncharacterized protein (TIGR03083 family)
VDVDGYIGFVASEGTALVAAAERAGLWADVPTTPGWKMCDLLIHVGTAHRWFAGLVGDAWPTFRPPDDPPAIEVASVVGWYRAGHERLIETLRAAPSDLDCWTLLPASSPLVFWARRAAHETAVHRADAQSATMQPRPAAPALGVDGIEELLFGFHARASSTLRTSEPRTLRVRAADTGDVWTIWITCDPPRTTAGTEAPAHCEVSGPAGLLYLALWNRVAFPELEGDASVADLWRERSAVRFE